MVQAWPWAGLRTLTRPFQLAAFSREMQTEKLTGMGREHRGWKQATARELTFDSKVLFILGSKPLGVEMKQNFKQLTLSA